MKQLGICLIVFWIAAFPKSACAWTTYLVSVGNNRGTDDELPLLYAERDASRLSVLMGRLGRVKSINTVSALGESAADLRQTLLKTNVRIRKAKETAAHLSCLVVYYSGHADARGLHLGNSILPFDELKTMVEGSSADVRILIIDACRSGGLTRVKGATAAKPFEIDMVNKPDAEGMVIITSSASGEDSYESEKMRSSFFSHHLLNGLRGAADKDGDRLVTLNEAYRYAYRETLRSSGTTAALQHPTYRFNLRGKGKLVLTYLKDDSSRFGHLRIATPGFYLLEMSNEQDTELSEISVGDKGARLVMPTGDYFVQRRDRAHYTEYRFSLAMGEAKALESLSSRTVKYAKLVRKGGGDKAVAMSIQALLGARGAVIDGMGVSPHGVLGVALDFPWFSIGLRGRYTQKKGFVTDDALDSIHREAGLDFTLQRYFDFRRISLSLGILLEGIYYRQQFKTDGSAPDVSSWSFAFGGIGGLEVEIIPALAFLFESGPLTHLYNHADTRNGAVVSEDLATRITWWIAGGLTWKL